MRERPEYFEGVVVTNRYLREYPEGKLAAQLFGTVSEISTEQMEQRKYKDVAQGTRIGQSGLEYQYDKYLRGTDGSTRLVVDAFGSRDEERKVSVDRAQAGPAAAADDRLDLQKTGERALAQAIQNSEYETRAGAFVAMDPRNGEILAMGSAPSFDASWFAKPFTQKPLRLPDVGRHGRAAAQPRDRVRVSVGVHVQADDRHGGARGRA